MEKWRSRRVDVAVCSRMVDVGEVTDSAKYLWNVQVNHELMSECE
jgi:hypothetical protein